MFLYKSAAFLLVAVFGIANAQDEIQLFNNLRGSSSIVGNELAPLVAAAPEYSNRSENETAGFSEKSVRKLNTNRQSLRPGTEDKMIYEGIWGQWMGPKGNDEGGFYVCGAEMRFEDSQGGGDDTAANGLKLEYCHLNNWSARRTADVYAGIWGSWKGMKMCPFGSYVEGAQVRFEKSQGDGDDTALNGLRILCRSPSGGETWITVYDGIWGDWQDSVNAPGKYVKLANMRFEGSQGGGDDTAWNGLSFRYETPNDGSSKAPVAGRWSNVASGPSVLHTLLESVQTTTGQTLTQEQASSVSVTVTAGFEFGSVAVTQAVSLSTASSVSSTIQRRQQRTIAAGCGNEASPTGTWVLWQWVMEQDDDATGLGFYLQSSQYKCTTSVNLAPKCPLGQCQDNMCQQCIV